MLLVSATGECKHKEEWEAELNKFWTWAELQSRYICNPRAKINKRYFKRPDNAFERYAKLIGLREVSYEGVF